LNQIILLNQQINLSTSQIRYQIYMCYRLSCTNTYIYCSNYVLYIDVDITMATER